MLSLDLTTPRENALEYFGTTDWIRCTDLMQERMASSKARMEMLGQLYDESLFPYEAQGPFETPLPTLTEISARIVAEFANKDRNPFAGNVVRIGPYMVKFGTNAMVMQVNYPSSLQFHL
jgi:hypothetical protein